MSSALASLPYCGAPPLPAELLHRFNLDPALILVLLVAYASTWMLAASRRDRAFATAGWAIAVIAFISPLCALSVALFSARVFQHMLLVLVAAPLIALALPPTTRRWAGAQLWCSASLFFLALWFWHMPVPYDATFASTWIYWSMHLTLFGSGILLWHALLHARPEQTVAAFAVGIGTSMHMGLLGAVLSLADRPLFWWHQTTTGAWGLSALQDQQLGGVFMWVPGILLFLWAALRCVERVRNALSSSSAA